MQNDFIETLKNRSYSLDSGNLTVFFEMIIKENKLITFINPYSYLRFRKKNIVYNQFDYILSDGILLTKLLNIFHSVNTLRISFDMTSLADVVFATCLKFNHSIYLIGSGQEEINSAQEKILFNYPNLNLIGFRNGYFKNEFEKNSAIENICNLNPKIILSGMGSGLQEEFLVSLTKNGWKGTGFTCGGFFHQVSEKLNYYPKYINKFNLRFIFRLYKEPKLFYRYFFLYPCGIILFFKDTMIHFISKSKRF